MNFTSKNAQRIDSLEARVEGLEAELKDLNERHRQLLSALVKGEVVQLKDESHIPDDDPYLMTVFWRRPKCPVDGGLNERLEALREYVGVEFWHESEKPAKIVAKKKQDDRECTAGEVLYGLGHEEKE